MPTISNSLVQPLVTPSTALFTSARASPCTAACESFSRTATRCPSLCSTLMPAGRVVSSLPFGPCTKTALPSNLTVTPLGIGIGFFPIRDISFQLLAFSSWLLALLSRLSPKAKGQEPRAGSLPNFAQQLAAYAFFAGLTSGHHAARGGQDINTHPAQHAWNFAAAHVDPAARARDSLRFRNRRLVVRAVLQINSDDLVTFFLCSLEVRDIALFFQNAGNLHLQPGSRNVYLLVSRLQRVAHPRQHICDRIGQPHRLLLLSPPVRSAPAENLRRLLPALSS